MPFQQHATEGDAYNALNNNAARFGITFGPDLGRDARVASALANLLEPATPGVHYFVDTINGDDDNSGRSWGEAFATMTAALAAVGTGGFIHFTGDVREECIGSNLKFDVTIIGHANKPRHPGWGTAPGSATWRPPASPTATTALCVVRAQGWRFVNILFDCPVDAAAVKLERNTLSGTSEYDASHAQFIGCRFDSGQNAIENAGGCGYVQIEDCDFYRLTDNTGCAITCSSTSVAVPLNWRIRNSRFQLNDSHILSSASSWSIERCTFGPVTSTAKYVDLTANSGQGEKNMVGPHNILAGTYDTDDYVGSASDIWAGNYVGGGLTTANPGSP